LKAKREEARSWFEKAIALNSIAAIQGLAAFYVTEIPGRQESYRQFLVMAGPVRRRRLRVDGRSAWR
jgi:hypothetical protein